MKSEDKAYVIQSLEVYKREIEKEGNKQLITISKFFAKYEIPVMIEKIKRMELVQSGRTADRVVRTHALWIQD